MKYMKYLYVTSQSVLYSVFLRTSAPQTKPSHGLPALYTSTTTFAHIWAPPIDTLRETRSARLFYCNSKLIEPKCSTYFRFDGAGSGVVPMVIVKQLRR